jgi:hypothetical protein
LDPFGERHALALPQVLEADALDGRAVEEEILLASDIDESEALREGAGRGIRSSMIVDAQLRVARDERARAGR